MKVVLITGASSGFGMLVAERLLAEGHAVYAAARRVERMAPLAAKGAHLLAMERRMYLRERLLARAVIGASGGGGVEREAVL
ncbi:MAG: SDR family NAD(P)-dependent oxidoreductase, partial [Polyangiaceae bacterium]|nr:SDR family NAD(P)-dependent oxidoreductase [Polyangiaceae bacterium]